MITDKSGLSKVGLALLRNNLGKHIPVLSIELKIRGAQQVVIVHGPQETFESSSFGWGRDDDRTKALSEVVELLEWQTGMVLIRENGTAVPLPLEDLSKLEPDKDQLIGKWRL